MPKEEIENEIIKGLANGSPYRPFGFGKKDLKGITQCKSWKYDCPNCGTKPPEEDYTVDGETYPQCYNEYLCGTDDGTTHDWDEVHKCPKCKTMFYYTNGCF